MDNYSKIIDITYIENDSNIGAGLSRKVGYDNSNSEYVMYVDSDDCFYHPLSVEMFYMKMRKNKDAQLVVGGYYQMGENLSASYVGYNITWLFSKMYKRRELDKFNIQFNEMRFSEDCYYNMIVFGNFTNIEFIDSGLYLWQNNTESLTRKKSDRQYDNMKTLIDAFMRVEKYESSHFCANTKVVETHKYDGLIMLYSEYCKVCMWFNNKENDYMESVLKYYRLVVSDINNWVNNCMFSERYNLIMKSYNHEIVPMISIYDWLWKLAEMNGEFAEK